jgi:hypothetical protein
VKQINYGIENLSSDPEFVDLAHTLAKEVEEIVETGTYLGLGTTLVFAKTGKPVISIECHPVKHKVAKKNLARFTNVTLLHAHSLDYIEMVNFIKNDEIYDQNIDVLVEKPGSSREFYDTEITCLSQAQNVLVPLVNNTKKQIILLDSAGGVGYLEFKKVMELGRQILRNKILILDDIQHVKHYRSVQDLTKARYIFITGHSGSWGYTRFEKKKNPIILDRKRIHS